MSSTNRSRRFPSTASARGRKRWKRLWKGSVSESGDRRSLDRRFIHPLLGDRVIADPFLWRSRNRFQRSRPIHSLHGAARSTGTARELEVCDELEPAKRFVGFF